MESYFIIVLSVNSKLIIYLSHFENFRIIYIKKTNKKEVTTMIMLGCKAVGLAALTFCVGVVAGLVLPICVVAVIEAVLIVIMGYCCLFRW